MPRRRVPVPYHPPVIEDRPPLLETRWGLLIYTISRLPPRQLPLLALYAYSIAYIADKGWISREALGKGGGSIVGVLSMVTGLLLSYRFSSAIGKWDEGKKVWVEVRTTIRSGIRMLSIPPTQTSSSSPASTTIDLGDNDNSGSSEGRGEQSGPTSIKSKGERRDVVAERSEELSGLLVGFAFALQHHLHGTRPLPQAPMCDLLPAAYLSSLKRTEARVRFAASHAGPSGTTFPDSRPTSSGPPIGRTGIRQRSTGSATKDESEQSGEDEWELSALKEKAEEAVAKLTEAVVHGGVDTAAREELRQQLDQLNLPDGASSPGQPATPQRSATPSVPPLTATPSAKPKSNLHAPYPPNLPLAMLKLMEAYVDGLAEVPPEKGGWSVAKRERGVNLVKALGEQLGDAEKLSSNPPPLPLTLHLSHLLMLYLAALPCSLLCVVTGWPLVAITLIAGWCLLGLEALISEVQGVFGSSENHLPLPTFTQQILSESLDISPPFARYYRSRLVSRVGEDTVEVAELDKRARKGGCGDEWVPSFG
ncbi:hypothetical protein IAT38_000135 [Cryptococcus sp. DSM 104549]